MSDTEAERLYCTGVTIPVMVFFAVFASMWGTESGSSALALLPASLAGGLAGFLIYNFHPAKVFMGDTGSLFLGAAVWGMACSSLSALSTLLRRFRS